MLRPPAAVAVTVIALLPKLTGTVAEKDPSAPPVLVTAAGPRSWCRPTATVTAAPGGSSRSPGGGVASVLPWAGAVMVTGSGRAARG